MLLEFKYRFLMPVLAHFPQKIAYRLASFYARLSRAQHKIEKQVIMQQMQSIFPEFSAEQLQSKTDYFLALIEREVLDTWFFKNLQTPQQVNRFIKLDDFHYVIEARKAKRRVIISSGHFGRFWMAGVGMQAEGISVGTITRDGGKTNTHGLPEAEYQYRLKKLAWLQQCFGGPFLVEGDSARPLYRALDDFVMGLFIDVPYHGDKNGCVTLPFLGKPTRFPLGPAKIAKRSGALIVPFYVFESRNGLRAQFHPPVDAQQLDERQIMLHLVALLEQQVMTFPEQWWLWQALPLMQQAE